MDAFVKFAIAMLIIFGGIPFLWLIGAALAKRIEFESMFDFISGIDADQLDKVKKIVSK
jgi:Trk-type K+ transport system membrane component